MDYTITATVEGLDQILRAYEEIGKSLVQELSIIQVEEMQQAIVVARNLAPTEGVVDGIEKEMLANARRGGSKGGARGVIWRTGQGIIDSIEFTKVGDLEVEGGVVGAGQMAREIEFGNRWINARPYWRPPVWEAWFRLRRRFGEVMERLWKK